MDRDELHAWLRRYETAWRTDGTDLLRTLFTEDVRYRPSPWQEPVRGLAELAEFWQKKIGIRTPDMNNNIFSLSGGNQQKALFARALGSDAQIVLMDDPMRGVDIGTKLEVYELIREEAAHGRTFLWYTTETDELDNCDRVYVFRNGRIVAELERHELTEEKVIQSSFAEASP